MSEAAGWREVLKALSRGKVAAMLALGFSSGLPFMLTGNTLGYWLREEGIELKSIAFLSWVGLAYSAKFLWAPLIDRCDVPLLGRWLGHRRGWMALSQIVVITGLAGMALLQPEGGLYAFALLALIAAFASATQDIVVDAWRIESAEQSGDLALLTSAYQLGYRVAQLVTDALILILAGVIGWSSSYTAMAAAMGIGLTATLLAAEPAVSRAHGARGVNAQWSRGALYDALVNPFVVFFRAHGQWALLMLAAISLYRLADFVMGPMANPFYVDLGLSKEQVGTVRGSVGLVAAFIGVAAAGVCAVRFGLAATLLTGAVIGPASNLMFSLLALSGPDLGVFAVAMAVDNFSAGFAGAALIGYMSSLTRAGYTATQYALLSSFYALPGKFLKGFSGAAVEFLARSHALLEAYALFFLGTAFVGVPALLLCAVLIRRRPPQLPSQGGPA